MFGFRRKDKFSSMMDEQKKYDDEQFNLVKSGLKEPALDNNAIEFSKEIATLVAMTIHTNYILCQKTGNMEKYRIDYNVYMQKFIETIKGYDTENNFSSFQVRDMIAISLKFYEEEIERLKNGGKLRDVA